MRGAKYFIIYDSLSLVSLLISDQESKLLIVALNEVDL